MAADGKERLKQLTEEVERKHRMYEEALRKKRRGLMRRLSVFGVVMLLATGVSVLTLIHQNSQVTEQEELISSLEEEQKVLQEEESRLSREIESLHDPSYIAEIARRDFLLTKPGEILFQVPREGESDD